jgi:hypothetical protein
LEKVVVALVWRVACGASIVIADLAAVQSFSCWQNKEVAEFEGEVSLGVAAAERSGKIVPIYGVDGRLGPFEPTAVLEEVVVSEGAADGAGEVVGNGLACHKELHLGGWEKRNAADEVGVWWLRVCRRRS